MTAVQISNLTDTNFQTANINVLLWASMEPNITVIIASIPTLRLLKASRAHSTRHHQKLFSRDKIRIVRTDDSRTSPMTVGAPIFKQQTGAGSTITANSTAPPRPPRPTSNQSFWTDSSSILKGGDNLNTTQQHRGLTHEASTEDLIQQSPVYSPNSAPYSPGETNNLGLPDRDTLKPSTNGKRLTPLEEESSLRGSSSLSGGGGMMMGNSNYASNFDSYYNNGNGNNNYRSSSKYSTGAFIDTYGAQAKNVVEGMELIVPLSQQQQQRQQQGQQQYQQSQYPQYQQQYSQQQQSPTYAHGRQQSSHRRKPSVTEAPVYMVPVTATGGYGGML